MSACAIDCEMVGSGNSSLLARVSIVDEHGGVLLDTYVKPTAHVTDYRTSVSGITEWKLANGRSFDQVQDEVCNLLQGKLLVGHSLQFDFAALHITVPEGKIRDLAKFKQFQKDGKPVSLKMLAYAYLNKTIQDGIHDSLEDARAAMEIYKKFAHHQWN